jgi:hypothetical protein
MKNSPTVAVRTSGRALILYDDSDGCSFFNGCGLLEPEPCQIVADPQPSGRLRALSKALKGFPHTPEHNKAIGDALRGKKGIKRKPQTLEHRTEFAQAQSAAAARKRAAKQQSRGA